MAIGMTEDAIINAIRNIYPDIGVCEVNIGTTTKKDRYTIIDLKITAPQKELYLIEKIYQPNDKELYNYSFIREYALSIPQIIYIDTNKGILLLEDLNKGYVQGSHFDEDDENGTFIRDNYRIMLQTAAHFHAVFWDNSDAFGKIGLDWRLQNKNNILTHINGMEEDYKKYRISEENGTIPKVWNIFENNIEISKLDYFQIAINMLREEYTGLIDTRYNEVKNITVIHGDLHPGNMFVSETGITAKVIDMEALRMGLGTEDLAMFLALHIEPDKEAVLSMLRYYHNCLCETVHNYSFELLMSDYRLSIMESMFFPIRLINHGIFDFSMRDKAMKAFETFVLNN